MRTICAGRESAGRKFLEELGVIQGGMTIGDLDMPPTFQTATNIMDRLAVPLRSYS